MIGLAVLVLALVVVCVVFWDAAAHEDGPR